MTVGKISLLLQYVFAVYKHCGYFAALVSFGKAVGLLCGEHTARFTAIPDFTIRLNTSDLAVCKQVFVEEDYSYATDQKISVILDGGANIGCAAVYFARKFPAATVIAVEPDDSNFELLLKNTACYPNIKPIKAAIWPQDKKLTVVDSGGGKWAMRAVDCAYQGTGARQNVSGLTIESVLGKFGISTIDILKIDIEGGELPLFRESPGFLNFVNILIVEVHDRWFPGTTRVIMKATQTFDFEWRSGENMCFCRKSHMPMHLAESQFAMIESES